jgi:hypothetical protein
MVQIGYTDDANHGLKSGQVGYPDGTNHKLRLIEVGGADGVNHVVWIDSVPVYFDKAVSVNPFYSKVINNSTKDNLIFSCKTTDDEAHSMNANIYFKLPYNTIYATSTVQFLRLAGYVAATDVIADDITINVHVGFYGTGNGDTDKRNYYIGQVDIQGNQNNDVIVSKQVYDVINSIDYYFFKIYVELSTESDVHVQATFSIPWDAFAWLPTGDKFEYKSENQ